jgi:hypothetical protein
MRTGRQRETKMHDDSFDRHFNEIRDAQKSAAKTARWLIPLLGLFSLASIAGLMAFAAWLFKWATS